MRASVRGSIVLGLVLSAGCGSEPPEGIALARPRSALVEMGYVVAPGLSTLEYAIDEGQRRLIFGGSPDLRIGRVITSAGVEVDFFGLASLQRATTFFRENPLRGPIGMTIEVENPTDHSIHLTVTSPEVHRSP